MRAGDEALFRNVARGGDDNSCDVWVRAMSRNFIDKKFYEGSFLF